MTTIQTECVREKEDHRVQVAEWKDEVGRGLAMEMEYSWVVAKVGVSTRIKFSLTSTKFFVKHWTSIVLHEFGRGLAMEMEYSWIVAKEDVSTRIRFSWTSTKSFLCYTSDQYLISLET